MTFAVNVAGGTGAGCRHVKERPEWRCGCLMHSHLQHGKPFRPTPRFHPGYRYSCPDCGVRNPAVTG